MSKIYGSGFRYNIGDLVKFRYDRMNVIDYKVGIVVEQSYRITRDNMFKILVKGKYYWQPADKITLLSKVEKEASK
tara:strand:+ start:1622 stop:1849 length:228 start_codon:yes stop_codon:yes gene_type:complete